MVDFGAADVQSRRSPSERRAPARAARATVEEWLRIPETERAELIGGRIVRHAFPGVKHGNTQARLVRALFPYDRRRPAGGGGGAPGGWWLSLKVDLAIADIACRPDLVGWRRDKHARVPRPDPRGVVTTTPDFLCEVLSASTARYDTGEKSDACFRAGVPHYWLVDPEIRTLTVLERTERGYLILRVAGPGEVVRAGPFEGVEVVVDDLFLDEEGELPEAETAAPAQPEEVKSAGTGPVKGGRRAGAAGAATKRRAPRRGG